jgi:hypothetical protein
MTRRSLQALFFQSSHPSDEELLACLDGELDERAAARVRAHLDTCWRCRGRRDRFDRTIAAFVDVRLEDRARRTGFPPSTTLLLSARLEAVDAKMEKRSVWTRLFWRARLTARTWPSPARLAQVSVGVLTAVLIVLSIGREPAVSAQELLARTVAAQEARLRPVVQPVVYQRLQVSRRGSGVGGVREMHQTWEIWSDTTHGRYRERVGAFAPIVERTAPDAGACAALVSGSHAKPVEAPAAGAAAGMRAPTAAGMPSSVTTSAARASESGDVRSGLVAAPPPSVVPGSAPSQAATVSAATQSPIRELESILCANGLQAAQPLSAAAFRDWRGRVGNASDRVNAQPLDGERQAMVLRTSLGDRDRRPNRIREAELVVRADDWHPLVQRFVVQRGSIHGDPAHGDAAHGDASQGDASQVAAGQGDADLVSYELRELSFEVVPLATVAPTFFDAPRDTTVVPPPATPAVEAVSEADLVSAEVQAWEALHRLGALLGEPVEVARGSSHRVEVRGLASTEERKQAIIEAVGAIPLVTVDVRTVDEALAAKRARNGAASATASAAASVEGGASAAPAASAARASMPTSPGASVTTPAGAVVFPPASEPPAGGDASTMIQTGVLPIQPLLDAYLPTVQDRTQAATDVVTLSRGAMSQAWALERLARFTLTLDAAAVRPSTRRTLERVALELAQATVEKLDALERRVTPIVSPVLSSPASASPASPAIEPSSSESPEDSDSRADASSASAAAEWPRSALQVFARVREADEKTRRLFTESDTGLVELGPAARALMASCEAGRRAAVDITRTLTPKTTEDPAAAASLPRPPR